MPRTRRSAGQTSTRGRRSTGMSRSRATGGRSSRASARGAASIETADLGKQPVAELRQRASQLEIPGRTRMNRNQLIRAIRQQEGGSSRRSR